MEKVQNEMMSGNNELVRSSIQVKSKKGQGPEETKDGGSNAILMKSKLGDLDTKLEDFKI